MKKILASLLLCLMASLGAHAEKWVALTAANFPDAEFRNYLKGWSTTGTSNKKPVYNTNMYDAANNMINVDAFSEVNINYANGTRNTISIKYLSIKSLEGIKLLRAVEKITLPNPGRKNVKCALTSLDVSGMPYLKTITNLSAQSSGFPYSTNDLGTTIPTVASGFTIPFTSLVAENCPMLEEVRVSAYKSLESISLAGSDNVKNLYVPGTGLRKLDISNLGKLFNEKTTSSYIDQDFDEAMGMPGYPNDAMKLMVTFSVKNCESLTELNLGNVNIHYLDISGCKSLPRLDVSGQEELFIIRGALGNKTETKPYGNKDGVCSSHTYNVLSSGVLREVVFGNKPIIKSVHLTGGLLRNIDLDAIGATVTDLDLSYNMFRNFDGSKLKKFVALDLSYNRIHNLVLPNSLASLQVTDNCLTGLPQLREKYGTRDLANINPFQYIRVGKVRKFKLFDDAEDAQYVESEDDTANQKYFYAPAGGHIGDPEADETDFDGNPTGQKEDPRYFYFNDDFKDGSYFYRNYYTKTDHFVHHWMKVTLCRSEALDFDPDAHEFYLSGDFNNWAPTEKDRFIYDDAQQKYFLQYDGQDVVHGQFRVWNSLTPENLTYNFGGHDTDFAKDQHKGAGNHVLFLPNVEHKMGTSDALHYTTYQQDNSVRGYKAPFVEMQLEPGSTANYVAIRQNNPTGIEGVEADDSDVNAGEDAPVEYFNLQGVKCGATTPGIYLRRRGEKVEKVVVR